MAEYRNERRYVSQQIVRDADEYVDFTEQPEEWLCHVFWGCGDWHGEFHAGVLAAEVLKRLRPSESSSQGGE